MKTGPRLHRRFRSGNWRRFVIFCLSLVLIFVFANFIYSKIPKILSGNDQWISEALTDRGQREDKRLFDAAVAVGFVFFDPVQDRFSITTLREFEDSQGFIVQSLAGSGYTEPKVIVRKLWRTRGPGMRIRRQMDDYNRTAGYAAIRDSTGRLLDCAALSEEDVGDERCHASTWVSFLSISNSGGELASVSALVGSDPGVRQYGELAADLIPNFRDWTSVSAESLTGRQVVFEVGRSTRALSAGSYMIDVIGRQATISSPGEDAALPIPVATIAFCRPAEKRIGLEICGAAQEADAVATRFIFQDNPVRRGMRISVVSLEPKRAVESERNSAYAVINQSASTNDLARILVEKNERTVANSYPLTPDIRLDCKEQSVADQERRITDRRQLTKTGQKLLIKPLEPQAGSVSGRRFCFLRWQQRNSLAALAPRVVSVNSLQLDGQDRSGTSLETANDGSGSNDNNLFESNQNSGIVNLSNRGKELGLTSVFGQSSVQDGSLLQALSRLESDHLGTVRISIDVEKQEIAARHFADLLVNKNGPGSIAQGLARIYDSDRRAGFVAISLKEDDFGGVLVATGFPEYRGNLSDWDLNAIREVRASRDPLAAHGWRHPDARYTPGSVFKLVSSLSLVDAVVGLVPGLSSERRQLAGQAIAGLPSQVYERAFGLSFAASGFQVAKSYVPRDGSFEVHDVNNVPIGIGKARLKPGQCEGGELRPEAAGQIYGVCDALIRSSNLWFSSVMLGINKDAIAKMKDGPLDEAEKLTSVSLLDRLFPERPFSLVDIDGLAPSSMSSLLADGPVLGLDRLSVSVEANRASTQLEVGLSAYGQASVQVTPLIMATISGAIATGRLVHPHIAADRIAARASPLYGPQYFDKALPYLEMIREGMKGVVNDPGGSAYNSFHKIVPEAANIALNVAGKTGTPNMGIAGLPDNVEGSWFTGYIKARDRNGRLVPQVAFACGISHVSQGGSRVCASLTAAILAEWAAKDGPL